MAVLKYNSVRYGGSGVDIQNTVDIRKPQPHTAEPEAEPEAETETESKADNNPAHAKNAERSRLEQEMAAINDAKEQLAKRESELIIRERENERLQKELAELKEQYISQGREVILEAKRRAEDLVQNAEQKAAEIVDDAEKNRGGVFIKARAEGFEQGKKDGVAAVLAQGQGILNEARSYAEQINIQKAELFGRYEKEIFETVMEIANKVTMNSMSVKDGTAAKKLIKKAAKDFRNSQIVRITLDENGASAELAGDYEYLKELCGGVPHVEVELLADADPGTVIVDNGEEITDAGIQTQLKMIRELGSGMFVEDAPKKRRKKSSQFEELPEDPEDSDDQFDQSE